MPILQSSLLGIDLGMLSWTDSEYSSKKKYLKWEETGLRWDLIDLSWEEIFILLEVFRRFGGGGMGSPYRADDYQKYIDGNPWRQLKEDFGSDSAKKLVKVYCRVNGIEYEESKEPSELANVSINEFERFVRDAVSVKIGF